MCKKQEKQFLPILWFIYCLRLAICSGICPLFAFFDLLQYIEAIICDAAAQPSECPQLNCTRFPLPLKNKILDLNSLSIFKK